MAKAILIAAVVVGVALPASARKLQNIALLEGTCGRMVALEVDMTSNCLGKVSNNSFDDGRASFTYVVEKPGMKPLLFTFSGNGRAQVKPNEDEAIQPIDLLLSNIDGKVLEDRAVGSCRFRNPYKPSAFINCSADTADGHYEATFGSNGKPPSMMRPNR